MAVKSTVQACQPIALGINGPMDNLWLGADRGRDRAADARARVRQLRCSTHKSATCCEPALARSPTSPTAVPTSRRPAETAVPVVEPPA
jgi:hypothetical protein